MPSTNPDQIERQFAELPMQLQLSLLERLLHRLRTNIAEDDEVFASALAAMASDPDIGRELKAIDGEFR